MITDYTEACAALLREGRGRLRDKSGRVVSGQLCNIATKWDDPDGIGYIDLIVAPGTADGVTRDEFECLLEDGDE